MQLTEDLPFAAAEAMVDYLADLGISHLYLSPFLAARPGTRHFYDVADHRRVDPVLGGADGLRQLAQAARAAGLGLVGDIVPNHMSAGPWSPVWDALLREGRSGDAAKLVDVDWEPPLPGATGKVILPVLAGPYGEELAAGRLGLSELGGEVRITYGDVSFPLNNESAEAVRRSDPAMLEGRAGEPRSWSRMHSLLEQQHYRLVSWRAGNRLVNYRRYQAVNDLVALRVDDPLVRETTHRTMLDLIADGTLDGLRVDHVDGLADPGQYLRWLRDQIGEDAWLVVEKLTSPDDPLPEDWPVDDTSGYELLRTALGIQIDPHGLRHLRTLAVAHGAVPDDFAVWRTRQHQLETLLGPDLHRVVKVVWTACQDEQDVRDVDHGTLLAAVSLVLTLMPAGRTYVGADQGTVSARDAAIVERALDAARRADDGVPDALWGYLGRLLTGQVRWTASAAEAVVRFQQLSGNVISLGVEERLFFRHNQLVSACELGCDPTAPTITVEAAHRAIAAMPPTGMRTTATHDTKHSEDVRMRITALAGMAGPWTTTADRILSGTAPLDTSLGLRLLQVAVGIWPITDDGSRPLAEVLDRPDLVERLLGYATRCARGQDVVTSHALPDPDAEAQLARWTRTLLDPDGGVAQELRPLALRAGEVGMAASLSQTVLRLTVPGVPDTYQGTERWDDSLLDPDNRRPVDMALCISTSAAWAESTPDPAALWASRRDGAIKQWVLRQALRLRREYPALMVEGDYLPLHATGRWATHLLGFQRVLPGQPTVTVICPRILGRVTDGGNFPGVGRIWADTEIALPGVADGVPVEDVLSGHTVQVPAQAPSDDAGPRVAVAELLRTMPVALLVQRPQG